MIGAWLALTLFGAFAAGQVSNRWLQNFSVPGKPAYEAGQRTLAAFGAGARAPEVVVFHTSGDATKSPAIAQAMHRAAATMPGALTSSYFSTANLDVRVARPAHGVHERLPRRPAALNATSGAEALRAAAANEPAGRDQRQRHRP